MEKENTPKRLEDQENEEKENFVFIISVLIFSIFPRGDDYK
jgi:hypothetical protein